MTKVKISSILKGSQFYEDSEGKARAYLNGIIKHAEEIEEEYASSREIKFPTEEEIETKSEQHEEKYITAITKTSAEDFSDGVNWAIEEVKRINNIK